MCGCGCGVGGGVGIDTLLEKWTTPMSFWLKECLWCSVCVWAGGAGISVGFFVAYLCRPPQ